MNAITFVRPANSQVLHLGVPFPALTQRPWDMDTCPDPCEGRIWPSDMEEKEGLVRKEDVQGSDTMSS